MLELLRLMLLRPTSLPPPERTSATMKLSDLEEVVALARARQDLQQAAVLVPAISISGPFADDDDMKHVLVGAYSAELVSRAGVVESRLAALGVEV
jgi:hypothetical protein